VDGRAHFTPLVLTYLLPLRTADRADVEELGAYLRELAAVIDDVLVVDGSSPEEIDRHREVFGAYVRVEPTRHVTLMGKVGNVVTGLERARHDKVVIADDDVRYTVAQLHDIADRLDHADVVRPQNYFEPLVWHARFDTARTLLARATGGDWPGTLALRRSFVLAAGGYAGDVLFENLELVRTVKAAGGREEVAHDILVARRPPTTAHFAGQQVRQAYDEFARPLRLACALAVAPLVVACVARRRMQPLFGGALLVVLLAECGRRRAGARNVFPASSSLLAPVWLAWRSLCSWAALGARARGGVRYRDRRLRRAATPMRALRNRGSAAGGDELDRWALARA